MRCLENERAMAAQDKKRKREERDEERRAKDVARGALQRKAVEFVVAGNAEKASAIYLFIGEDSERSEMEEYLASFEASKIV